MAKPAVEKPDIQSANQPANNERLAAQAQSQLISGPVAAISKTPEQEEITAATQPAVIPQEPTAARLRLQQGPRDGIIFPSYPPAAWKNGKRGRVVLRAQVAPAGAVSGIEVLSGDPALAEAARRAMLHWHYEEQNAPAEVVVHFDFINPEAISLQFEP
jgi:TonB family protein